ncbi:gp457 [Bacillus phage G]|uniref:Gp457 n=1 Tax=Bacillus phage G TaxID=2884420 RepID=G3MAJ8_9CAUD|nr:gp457 [Bacillus phage G]AEO93715.1 gp457 [Bacillus phage G]
MFGNLKFYVFKGILMRVSERDKLGLKEIIKYSDKITIQKSKRINLTIYQVTAESGKIKILFNFGVKKISRKFFYVSHVRKLQNIANELYLAKDKDLKKKVNSITCKNKVCPICGSKVDINREIGWVNAICINKCYRIQFRAKNYTHVLGYDIFSKVYQPTYHDLSMEERIKEINTLYKKISYWKEDEKYLFKLLEQG